jgi:hypothetical protein
VPTSSNSEYNPSGSVSPQNSTPPVPAPNPNTRTTRIPRGQPPINFSEAKVHSVLTSPQEPKTFKEAMRGPDATL